MGEAAMKRVLAGNMQDLPPLNSRIVRIFISSTFSDTSKERNILMEKVYPELKAHCREKHGLEFQVVDMRWGVTDEETANHSTSALCLQEIRNCQQLSSGPNFVAFLGQRYGFRPIPSVIDKDEFESLVEELEEKEEDCSLLKNWYEEDRNAIPPVYILHAITHILPDYLSQDQRKREEAAEIWKRAFREIQRLLRQGSEYCTMKGTLSRDQKDTYYMSVTENEILSGVMDNHTDTSANCLCFVRMFTDIQEHTSNGEAKGLVKKYMDLDDSAQKLLSELRDTKLPSVLGKKNIAKFSVTWDSNGGINPHIHQDYLKTFSSKFYKLVSHLVDDNVAARQVLAGNELFVEVLQHITMAKERCDTFHGRADILGRVKQCVLRDSKQPIVIYGDSGSGKTSVMAKISSVIGEWVAGKSAPTVILRFLGTSPDSSGVHQVLKSVCQQIAYNYVQDEYNPPNDYNLLVREFQDILGKASKKKPLVIMLDSLDQLSPRNYAFRLSWLPRFLPEHVHIIISTLPIEHGILETLRKRTKNANFVNVPVLGDNLSFDILNSWMKTKGRTLTQDQTKLVKAVFTKCSLPLFVKLIFEEVLMWKSTDVIPEMRLSHTIRGVISDLFDRLERKHGHVLVTHALAYMTAAKNGLSETELEDILSLDDEVLSSVFQYHIPPVRRIPQLLWVRISHDISTYVVTREADGARVTYWYHRQFIESAQARYLKNESFSRQTHSAIADYFSGTWNGKEKPFEYTKAQIDRWKFKSAASQADRKVAAQPLVFARGVSNVRYNLRKLNNLTFHLCQADRLGELKSMCLFNYEWLLTKLKATSSQAILSDFEMLTGDVEVDLLRECLSMSRSALAKYPTTLSVEIHGRLVPFLGDEKSGKYPHIRRLLDSCVNEGILDNSLVARQQCLPAPGGPLKYSLEHAKVPNREKYIHVTPDGANVLVLTYENELIVWDLVTGDIEKECRLPAPEDVRYNVLELSPDQRHVCIATAFQKENNPIIVYDTLNGDVLHSVNVEKIYRKIGFTEKFKPFYVNNNILINNVGKEVDLFDTGGQLLHSFNIPASQTLVTSDERYVIFLIKNEKEMHIYDLTNLCFVSKTETSGVPILVLCSSDMRVLYVQLKDSNLIDVVSMESSSLDNVGRKMTTINTGDVMQSRMHSMELSIDNKYLLLTTPEGFLLWDTQNNKLHKKFEVPDEVKPIHRVMHFGGHLTWDNKSLLGFHEGHIIMWDTSSGKVLMVLHGSKWPITFMVVPMKTSLFVTATEKNNILSVWDATKFDTSLEHSPLSMAGATRYATIAKNCPLMAARSHATDVRIIDVNSGQFVSEPSRDFDAMKPSITDDGRYTLLRDYNSNEALRAWESRTAKLVSTFPLPSLYFKLYCPSQNSKWVATHMEESPTVNYETQICDIASGKTMISIKAEQGGLSALFFCGEDRFLMTLQQYPQENDGRDCKIHCYSSETGERNWTLGGFVNDSLVLIPGGSNVLAIKAGPSGPDGDECVILNVSGGTLVANHKTIPKSGTSDFSGDGTLMVDNVLRVIKVISGEIVADFKEITGSSTTFSRGGTPCLSADGHYLVWLEAKKGLINLGKVSTQTLIGICPTHSTPLCLQLSSTNVVAVGCDDGRVMLLQVVDSDVHDITDVLQTFPKKDSSQSNMRAGKSRAPRSSMCSLL